MDDQDDVHALRNGESETGHFSIISGIVYHPDWESVLYRADIALMKMEVPVLQYSGKEGLKLTSGFPADLGGPDNHLVGSRPAALSAPP